MQIILRMSFEIRVNDKKLTKFIELLNNIENITDDIISGDFEFIEVD